MARVIRGFSAVRHAFEANFESGLEAGTACAVVVDGDVPVPPRRSAHRFPKLGSAFAASSLGVAEVGTGQLARIVDRETSPPLAT
jgi:hypothetical protein